MSAAVRKGVSLPRELHPKQRVEVLIKGEYRPGTVERIGRKYVYVQLDTGGEPVAFYPHALTYWQNRSDR